MAIIGRITLFNYMKNYAKAFVFGLFMLIPASAVYAQYDYYNLPPDYPPCYYDSYGCGYNYGAISITDVSGPNSLTVGQSGTWRVTTNAPSNSNISVSVDWGDYNQYPVYMAASAYQVSQNNTFTHSYQNAGTYTITFTASDSYGRSNTSSVTVQVGGGGGCGYYGCNQSTFTASPTSGQAPLGVFFTATDITKGSTYYISYGDGTGDTMTLNPPPLGVCYYGSAGCNISYSASANHTYTQAGTYTVQLTEQPSYYCPPGSYCTQMMPVPRVVGTVVITVYGGGWCNWWDWSCGGMYQGQNYYYDYYYPTYDYQNYYQTYDYYGANNGYNYYW